jgi:hypothetical protein
VQPHQQPRTYRIRLFRDNDNQRLTHRQDIAVLDFSAGPGLRATQGQLDGLVQSLAYADNARGSRTLDYYLGVYEENSNDRRYTWPATTWLED